MSNVVDFLNEKMLFGKCVGKKLGEMNLEEAIYYLGVYTQVVYNPTTESHKKYLEQNKKKLESVEETVKLLLTERLIEKTEELLKILGDEPTNIARIDLVFLNYTKHKKFLSQMIGDSDIADLQEADETIDTLIQKAIKQTQQEKVKGCAS